jgi:hypothetical protein
MDQTAEPTPIFDHECEHWTSLQALEVDFTLPKAGWIFGRIRPLHQLYGLSCSYIHDPFGEMIAWLEQIAGGAEAATWRINQESCLSRVQFYGGRGWFGDGNDYLFHIGTGPAIERVRGVEVSRRQVVESFYRGFRAMADNPAYTPREWDRHPHYYALEEIEDDADYEAAMSAYPYAGLPLRTLTSAAIEAWLNDDLDEERQLSLSLERPTRSIQND